MGLISSVKGLFSDALVGEVVTAYGLKRSDQAYQLWTGHASNCLIAIEQAYDKKRWYITAGDRGPDKDEEDSIYLERFDPADPPTDLEPDENLDRFPALAGSEAARQYLVGALPVSGNYAVMDNPRLRDLLPRFSPAVEFVELYFNRGAVLIGLRRDALDRVAVDQDLALAIELAKALGG